MSERKQEKEKKEKIVYVDDGRTIADMSGVQGGASRYFRNTPSYSTGKEKWTTFFDAFRMMLLPTAVMAGGLAVAFGIVWLLFKFVVK